MLKRRWSQWGLITAVVIALSCFVPAHAGTTCPHGQVSLCFDDGYTSLMTTVMPMLDDMGMQCTCYIPTGFIGTPGCVSWCDVKKIQDDYGCDIGAHSVHHLLMTQLSDEDLEEELVGCKKAFEKHGICAKSFATPFGDYDNRVLKAIARHYQAHRPFKDQGMNIWPYNHYRLLVQQVQGGVSVTQVKSWIDSAMANKCWLVLVFHDIKDNPSQNPADYQYGTRDLQAIMNYLDRRDVPVVTVADGLASTDNNLFGSMFNLGASNGWQTTGQNIKLDTHGNGCLPTVCTSVQCTSVQQNTYLLSPKVPVAYGSLYGIKCFESLEQISAGEVGYYVDEFDGNGNWISGRYLGGAREPFVEEVGFSYNPTSANVKQASLQIIITGGCGIQAFIDAPQWLACSPCDTSSPKGNKQGQQQQGQQQQGQ